MRKNNWKAKVFIFFAFIIGIAAGITAAIFIPEEYAQFRGLCAFGTIALVAGVIVFIGVRLFRVGED